MLSKEKARNLVPKRVCLRRAGKRFGTVYGPRRVLIIEEPPFPALALAVEIDGEIWIVTSVNEIRSLSSSEPAR
jgi:hypothetical protein